MGGYFKCLVCIVLILLVHDLGHLFFLKLLGYKIERIEILPFGANIETNINLNSPSFDIILISIAGIIFQIILYFIFVFIYKFSFISDSLYEMFLKYNTLLILFNLLPIYPLDGNKLIHSILECFINYKMSLLVSAFISLISSIVFLYVNYLFELDNYPIVIFLIFKVLTYIKDNKYIFNKFLLERTLFDFNCRKTKNVNSINKIYKNRFNFINGVSEKKILLKKFNK